MSFKELWLGPIVTGQTDKYWCQSTAKRPHLHPRGWAHHWHSPGATSTTQQSSWGPKGGLSPSPDLGTPSIAGTTGTTGLEVSSVRFSLKLCPYSMSVPEDFQSAGLQHASPGRSCETNEPWTYGKLMSTRCFWQNFLLA